MAKGKLILPGEELAIEEEYTAGIGTFVESGVIRAAVMGTAVLDESTREARVEGNVAQAVSEGDIVIGKIILNKKASAVVELVASEAGKKIVSPNAQLPIRNVSSEFVEHLSSMFKTGDYIRARITQATPLGIDLTTNEEGLGVVKAFCSRCRKEMSYSNGKLMCLACGSVEERRWHSAPLAPRGERRDSRDGGRREGGFREGGRGGFGGDRNRGFGGGGFNRERRDFQGPREGGFNRDRQGGFSDRGPRQEFSNDRGNFQPRDRENRGGFSGDRRESRGFENRDRRVRF